MSTTYLIWPKADYATVAAAYFDIVQEALIDNYPSNPVYGMTGSTRVNEAHQVALTAQLNGLLQMQQTPPEGW